MTRNEFVETVKANWDIGYRGYRMADDTATLIIDAVTTDDRDRIIRAAHGFGLSAETVQGSEWYGHRPNVRLVVTGFSN